MAKKDDIGANFLSLLGNVEKKNVASHSRHGERNKHGTEKSRNKHPNGERAEDKKDGKSNINSDQEHRSRTFDGGKPYQGRNVPKRNCSDNLPGMEKKQRVMGYKYLEDLLDRDSFTLVTTLADPRSGFQELLKTRPMRPDLLILIVNALNKVNNSEIPQLKMQILSDAFTPELIDEIKKYAGLICIEDNKDRLKSVHMFYENILNLFDDIIDYFPSLMTERLKSVMVALDLSMKNTCEMLGIQVKDNLFVKAKSITDQINSSIERKRTIEEEQRHISARETVAPNNFRDIPIIPTQEDFLCDKAFLRRNIIKGSYKDVEQYLDVQFRLLREDFISPLRSGIFEYIESLSTPQKRKRYSNVRIYPKVQFMKPIKVRDLFGFQVHFDCENRLPKTINWEYNKRFMTGSLLLFSDNNFQSFYAAVVMDRDMKLLPNKLLNIAFLPGVGSPDNMFIPGTFFVMAESEVYYEAYRHVLSALQKMKDSNFPMKQYIVNTNTQCLPPGHIINTSVYMISGFEVDILEEESWPTPNQLRLNQSQHKAFKSALTNDLAVIQGPPGTGKTFLALKITEVFLKNHVSPSTPIIVVCFTNHALDQFLEGILQYTKQIIRIGSQSQNEALKQYSIDEIRKVYKVERRYHLSGIYREAIDEKNRLDAHLKSIENNLNELSVYAGIVDFETLRTVITAKHYNQLIDQELAWLLFSDAPDFLYTEQEQCEVADFDEVNQESFENIDENEDIIQEEEEIDYEENDQRFADMNDDDLFDEGFTTDKTEHFAYRIRYKVFIESIDETIGELYGDLRACTLPPRSNERVFFETYIKEQIQHHKFQRDFIISQINKYKNVQFNVAKLQMLQNTSSVWDIHPNDRWEYYMIWIHFYGCQLKEKIQHVTKRYQDVILKLQELRQLDDLQFVKNARIVGLTTTGAAKRRVLLENLKPTIVIFEEAAEVLEAHIVTSLTQAVQHVILIGDHKQLRPKPSVFELAKKYHMDVSLFERMLNNGLNCSTLDVQHRMRPEIASLIVPTIYPSLINHPTTLERPNVTGIDRFVFFLTHTHPEDQVSDSQSRQNKHEADFLMALCNHLLLQGYKPEEITILATYSGQVWYMKKERRRLGLTNQDWKGVRITPVDNYQGEENRIILLSLVRSNTENRIGFLSTENRVCVALSRAREGLYIIGNMNNLTTSSTIWPKIKQQLELINGFGQKLTLRCARHPEMVTLVSTARDFSTIPEGGCSQKCMAELDCGHFCPRVCHIIDKEHGFYKCLEFCTRGAPCEVEGHRCPLRCWQPCPPCGVFVVKQLSCGHDKKMECHREPASVSCHKPVRVTLPQCKHEVDKPCYLDVNAQKCTEPCTIRLPCGHSCRYKCHVNDDPDHCKYECRKECDKPVVACKRNHKCPKKCYEVCGNCMVLVQTELPCGHVENIPCSENPNEFVCHKPCTKMMSCGHKCLQKCWVECDPKLCTEKVDKVGECGHVFTKMKCNQSLDTRKCTVPCARLLKCGHPCTDKCLSDCTKVTCVKQVESEVQPACGHPRITLPCHLNQSVKNGGSDELLPYCQVKCEARLACGHTCTGTCGRCMQGRIHVPCTSQCNKLLFCGHRCVAECGVICPPCFSKDCLRKCSHYNQCNYFKFKKKHVCSQGCPGCTRPCTWACEHYSCRKKCGEVCDRPRCDQPCRHVLECGHECVGYCGEVHPTLCRVCHADNPVIAANPYGRFVVLEDCKHVIEADQLLVLEDIATSDHLVRLMRCPECNEPIVTTMRCRSMFLRFLKDVAEVNRATEAETNRLKLMHARYKPLFQLDPTPSAKMNKLLVECSQVLPGNPKAEMGRLLLTCLLKPLVEAIEPLSNPPLKSRLNYLANLLHPRLSKIGYQDVLQIELEVARICRLTTHMIHGQGWFDISCYTWDRDRRLADPWNKFSSTFRTLDLNKRWHRCTAGDHLYVSENNEECCVDCDEKREQERLRQIELAEKEKRKLRNRPEHRDTLDRLSTIADIIINEQRQPDMVTDYRNFGRGRGQGGNRRGKSRGGRGRGPNRGGGRRGR